MPKISLLAVAATLAVTAAAHAQGTTAQPMTSGAPLPVIAEITAKPEDAAAIRSRLVQGAAKAKTEPGCLSYVLYEDRDHPGHFFTYETWTGDAALNAHLSSPTMRAGFAKLGPMLVGPPVITRLKQP